jgi:hypothetical protein
MNPSADNSKKRPAPNPLDTLAAAAPATATQAGGPGGFLSAATVTLAITVAFVPALRRALLRPPTAEDHAQPGACTAGASAFIEGLYLGSHHRLTNECN